MCCAHACKELAIDLTLPCNFAGIKNNDCGAESHVSSSKPSSGYPNYLYVSKNNIIYDYASTAGHAQISAGTGCTWDATTFESTDPAFYNLPRDADENLSVIDPRPTPSSAAFSKLDAVPTTTLASGDNFFETTTYKGAFGNDLWLSGLSILDVQGKLPRNDLKNIEPLCGDITSSKTLTADKSYMLSCQTFVKK